MRRTSKSDAYQKSEHLLIYKHWTCQYMNNGTMEITNYSGKKVYVSQWQFIIILKETITVLGFPMNNPFYFEIHSASWSFEIK